MPPMCVRRQVPVSLAVAPRRELPKGIITIQYNKNLLHAQLKVRHIIVESRRDGPSPLGWCCCCCSCYLVLILLSCSYRCYLVSFVRVVVFLSLFYGLRSLRNNYGVDPIFRDPSLLSIFEPSYLPVILDHKIPPTHPFLLPPAIDKCGFYTQSHVNCRYVPVFCP